MSADIHPIFRRILRDHGVKTNSHVYTAVLLRDDVSLGELAHALRFSGIVLTTDPMSGQTLLHRAPAPGDAA
jgi:hypothetical protein